MILKAMRRGFMRLYSERHGIRAPQEKTYSISIDVYALLLDCCKRYQKNLTHIFIKNSHHDFTDSDYITFDESGFITRIKVKIPLLFRDDYGRISIPQYGDEYDQYSLLDLIEFFGQNVKDISERWNNERYRNYQTIDCYDSSDVFTDFQEAINEIFFESGLLYELTDEKIIERIANNSSLTMEMENSFKLVHEQGTKDLLKDAVALYKTPNPAARQDSVEKIWDAFERLKTYYTMLDKKLSSEKIVNDMAKGDDNFVELFNVEFRALTDIGNKFRIRHHETNKVDIADIRYYDYLFNRCLSLINLAVQYLD